MKSLKSEKTKQESGKKVKVVKNRFSDICLHEKELRGYHKWQNEK